MQISTLPAGGNRDRVRRKVFTLSHQVGVGAQKVVGRRGIEFQPQFSAPILEPLDVDLDGRATTGPAQISVLPDLFGTDRGGVDDEEGGDKAGNDCPVGQIHKSLGRRLSSEAFDGGRGKD